MKTLNVLAVAPALYHSTPLADQESLRLIRKVSPVIKVKDGAALVQAELHGDFSRKRELDVLLAWADVIFGLVLPPNTVARAPNLKWMQSISAGLDRWTNTDIWKSPVVITGTSGIHATSIGEFVLSLMLMFAKNAPLSFKLKQERRWKFYLPQVLRGKPVGIVGLGDIGREVARLSKAFGMNVVATRRSTKKPGKARNVDLLLPRSHMKKLLAHSDYVVLCVPLTPETRHIMGEREFRSMKRTARVINIGRGQLMDETALIHALEEKWIAGAGLDVTYTEPLPKESRLWEMENVILSPHISGGMEDYMMRATELFCENLRRWLAGKKLINIVDRKRGY
jgi:phosphoglycerate dehydrogenase-like enzyme